MQRSKRQVTAMAQRGPPCLVPAVPYSGGVRSPACPLCMLADMSTRREAMLTEARAKWQPCPR